MEDSMTTESRKKKVFVMAGEASGDLHGSHVVRRLVLGSKEIDACEVVCWGGDMMAEAGGKLLSHYKERSIMGLWEVIRNLRKISQFLDQAKIDILAEKPDLLLLIDNPGFNLRIADWAKSQGITVHYYIAPKAWAWNTGRIKTMRRVIEKLYVIFPFEVSFFAKHQMLAEYVGNPILEEIDRSLQRFHDQKAWDVDLAEELMDVKASEPISLEERFSEDVTENIRFGETLNKMGRVILLMPGSRKNEVKSLLPNFVAAARKFDNQAMCVVAGAPGLDAAFYQEILAESVLGGLISQADFDSVKVYFGATYHLLMQLGDGELIGPIKSRLQKRGLALVASGTATLETALLGVPQVVAYRVNGFTYFMAKRLVNLRWVSLVNILLNRGLLEEHLQDVSPERLSMALTQLSENQSNMQAGYQELRDLLAMPNGSSASDVVVRGILRQMR
ncbi:lipid-A-disaccharide synthase [Bacteroidota bacterium]|nr:lipid-A-disaccharide synthase [Bacteroidota bacterium]